MEAEYHRLNVECSELRRSNDVLARKIAELEHKILSSTLEGTIWKLKRYP